MAKGECLTFISAVAMKTAKHTIILRGTSLNLDGRDQASENSSVVYQSKAMTITAQGQSPASAPRINHQQLRNCHQAGEADSKWLWHNCTMQGWGVETERRVAHRRAAPAPSDGRSRRRGGSGTGQHD